MATITCPAVDGSRSKSKRLPLCAAILLPLLFCLELWWLDCSRFQVLAGDDIRCFPTALQGFTAYNSLVTAACKFRPLTALLIWGSAALSSAQYHTLLLLGIGIHALNAFLFFCLLRRVLKVSLGFSLALTVIATFNRFSAYLMTPELAIMEGAAITCYLLFLWALLRLIDTSQIGWAVLVGLCFLMILHIHERYMVLAVVCLLVSALLYRGHRSAALVACGCTLLSLAINFAAKKVFLQVPILMGTETRAIEFHPKTVLGFVADGLLNLLGMNRGPSHLSLLDYAAAPPWLKLTSVASVVLGLIVLGCAMLYTCKCIKSGRLAAKPGWMLAVLLCLVLALVLSASITVRQEYRWLYPAYLTLLILLGLGTHVYRQSFPWPIAQVALVGFMVLAIPTELFLREHRDSYYARGAYRVANNLYALIHRSPELMALPEIVIGGDVIPERQWYFMGDAFAEYYRLPRLVFASSAPPDLLHPVGLPSIVYQEANATFALSSAPGKNQVGAPAAAGRDALNAGSPVSATGWSEDGFIGETAACDFNLAKPAHIILTVWCPTYIEKNTLSATVNEEGFAPKVVELSASEEKTVEIPLPIGRHVLTMQCAVSKCPAKIGFNPDQRQLSLKVVARIRFVQECALFPRDNRH